MFGEKSIAAMSETKQNRAVYIYILMRLKIRSKVKLSVFII